MKFTKCYAALFFNSIARYSMQVFFTFQFVRYTI